MGFFARLLTWIVVLLASTLYVYAAPCTLRQLNPSVTVCTPGTNALVQSPVHVVAGSTDTNPVTAM